MSDNLEVAKECGSASVGCYVAAFHTTEELEAFTCRILAKQQAAHDAEIAELRKEIVYAERCAVAQTEHAKAALEKLSAAVAACAMNDEALKAVDACFSFRDEEQCRALKKLSEAISASPQQVAEWERKQLEPLRAQVAMLHKLLAKFSYNEYGPKRFPDEDAVLDAINNTQSIAEQFITECEQRGAVKALEEVLTEYRRFPSDGVIRIVEANINSLSATSKKAG